VAAITRRLARGEDHVKIIAAAAGHLECGFRSHVKKTAFKLLTIGEPTPAKCTPPEDKDTKWSPPRRPDPVTRRKGGLCGRWGRNRTSFCSSLLKPLLSNQLNMNCKTRASSTHHIRLLATSVLLASLVPIQAQFGPRAGGMGGPPRGPRLSGALAKLFGDNSAFSAAMEMQTKDPNTGETLTMPGQISFAEGKSRFEMDMTKMKGGKLPPDAGAQMKAMGMAESVMISRPDKKVAYMVYPGLQAYLENPLPEADAPAPATDYKVETTELGKETVDGHPCVKNKVVVTDSKGEKHESTVWNAADLKSFPIKIEHTEEGQAVTMVFKDIKLSKPEASVFDPPADYARHESMQAMMQQVMMKRLGAGQGSRQREK
jgi:hypothetical protein